MAFVLRGASSGGHSIGAGSNTVTLPVTTNAGDCIFLGFGTSGESGGALLIGSGAGATWVNTNYAPGSGTGQVCYMAIGYNCSAGQTTCTFSNPNTYLGWYVVGVFSGVQTSPSPLLSSVVDTSGSGSGLPQTSPSASYTVGNMLVGLGESFEWAASPGTPSWSNGSTDNAIDAVLNPNQRAPWMSYIIPGSGSSTTYTTPTPLAGNGADCVVAVIKGSAPPPPPVSTNRFATSVAAIRASQR